MNLPYLSQAAKLNSVYIFILPGTLKEKKGTAFSGSKVLIGQTSGPIESVGERQSDVCNTIQRRTVLWRTGEICTLNFLSENAGLSLEFLAEWWKWPGSSPVPSSLGNLPRLENRIKIRHHHSYFL